MREHLNTMRKHLNKIFPLMFVLLWIFSMTVVAGNGIDPDHMGSITVTLTRDSQTVSVSDGVLSVYWVAEAVSDENGGYFYSYTSEFSNCGVGLTDLTDPSFSTAIAEYAEDAGAPEYRNMTPHKGVADFTDLPLGIYLVEQTSASTGYYEILPFVITIPQLENGVYIYDVNASPKMETITGTPSTGGDEPPETSGNGNPETTSGGGSTTTGGTGSTAANGGNSTKDTGTGTSGTVKTGDNTMIELTMMMLIMAMLIFVATGVRMYKRHNN